jgi:hypothetical protein
MSKDEIKNILLSGTRDDKRVFKSGARTGLTHALIDDLSPWSEPRPDDGTRFTIVLYRRIRDHSVQETRTNPHVLAFKQLWSDKTEYEPGSRVNLSARIGSSHSRPCDSYYVVAQFIPDRDPSRLISTVLSPVVCYIEPDDKRDIRNCIDFSQEKSATDLGAVVQRGRVRFIIPSTEQENKLVDLNSDENRELLLLDQLIISVPPCKRIEATIVSAGPKLKMNAYHAGKLVGEIKSDQIGDVTLATEADVIDSVILISDPEYNPSSISKFCYTPNTIEHNPDTKTSSIHIRSEEEEQLLTSVCCYTGHMDIPNNEQVSAWKGYLIVQNINDTPQGTRPEKAAETIGGIIMSQNLFPQPGACGAIMVADHI